MTMDLDLRALTPAFGTEVCGVDPALPVDEATCRVLQDLFDRRGVLLFRDLELTNEQQIWISKMLIRQQDVAERPGSAQFDDNFYVSNKRPKSAAPFGRLQFHADTMWAEHPFEVLSLYGAEVEQPSVPTTFVSGTHAWATLPAELRARVEGLSALHTAGAVRRGDTADVLVTTVERPPTTVKAVGHRHPRTGETILYVCEQMTQEIVGLDHDESEALLGALFAHLYDPAHQWHHVWRQNDFVVWDNLALQHARQNVLADGPARTLRKAASPVPQLNLDQLPTYSAAR
jgi:alpha-ketoglutarate-dependent taurine dioxygenase